jgi:hypothetical protein
MRVDIQTNLNEYEGTESVEEGPVRLCALRYWALGAREVPLPAAKTPRFRGEGPLQHLDS